MNWAESSGTSCVFAGSSTSMAGSMAVRKTASRPRTSSETPSQTIWYPPGAWSTRRTSHSASRTTTRAPGVGIKVCRSGGELMATGAHPVRSAEFDGTGSRFHLARVAACWMWMRNGCGTAEPTRLVARSPCWLTKGGTCRHRRKGYRRPDGRSLGGGVLRAPLRCVEPEPYLVSGCIGVPDAAPGRNSHDFPAGTGENAVAGEILPPQFAPCVGVMVTIDFDIQPCPLFQQGEVELVSLDEQLGARVHSCVSHCREEPCLGLAVRAELG